MFFRQKRVGDRTYLQIVESRREGGSVRQHVVATLGRAEEWVETGKLDALLRSGVQLTETALVLSAVREDKGLAVESRRIGAPLIFSNIKLDTCFLEPLNEKRCCLLAAIPTLPVNQLPSGMVYSFPNPQFLFLRIQVVPHFIKLNHHDRPTDDHLRRVFGRYPFKPSLDG